MPNTNHEDRATTADSAITVRRQTHAAGFEVISHDIIRHPRLSPAAKSVLIDLLAHADDFLAAHRLVTVDGYLQYARAAYPAAGAHLGRDAYRRVFRELEAEGFIVRKRSRVAGRPGGREVFRWTITLHDQPGQAPAEPRLGTLRGTLPRTLPGTPCAGLSAQGSDEPAPEQNPRSAPSAGLQPTETKPNNRRTREKNQVLRSSSDRRSPDGDRAETEDHKPDSPAQHLTPTTPPPGTTWRWNDDDMPAVLGTITEAAQTYLRVLIGTGVARYLLRTLAKSGQRHIPYIASYATTAFKKDPDRWRTLAIAAADNDCHVPGWQAEEILSRTGPAARGEDYGAWTLDDIGQSYVAVTVDGAPGIEYLDLRPERWLA